ncbi:hypothetical protein BASA81_011317 [Batrachochytrium salamandrivorans]|nr:hypothetical protein BASA81_011317 [Batrachochytrium salamandrivorans]
MIPSAGKPMTNNFSLLSSSHQLTGIDQEHQHVAEDGSEEEESKSAMPKTATWQSVGLLLIADVVGAGVMTLATAFAELGWVLSLTSLVFWYVASMYVGLLVQTAHVAYPECENFMQLGKASFGRKAELCAGVLVYVFVFFALGDYVLILGETLEMMSTTAESAMGEQGNGSKCAHLFYSFIASILLLPLSTVRLLGNTTGMMLVNAISILASLLIAFVGVAVDRANVDTVNPIPQTEWFSSQLSLYTFFHAQALFAFAFSGAYLYLEIIAEMQDSREFRKSLLYLSGPFQFSIYLLAGSVGYLLFGSKANGLLIKMVPFGFCYQLAAFLLSVHMVLTFLVKGTILSRAVHTYLFPVSARDFKSWHAQRVFVCICVLLIAGCFLVANLVPFFDDLTSLLGAMNAPWIGYVMPVLFAIKAKKLLQFEPSKGELAVMYLLCMFMGMLFVFGVVSSFENIVTKWATYGKPFAGCL